MESFDKIIIGAGLYGLYSALRCGLKGQRVLVLECDNAPFQRATYINQARVHQGYHYPRSLSTAVKSAGYFERFNRDFDFCINGAFNQIYATSKNFSWTNGEQFKDFCTHAGIPCEELHVNRYFNEELCDGAFLTREYTYDARQLKEYFLSKLASTKVEIHFSEKVSAISCDGKDYIVRTNKSDGLSLESSYRTNYLLNASYASTNQILEIAGFEKFKIKYELCEIILCDVNEEMKNYGFTVMDGPFFSIMPFGNTGLHSLTAVSFTPHADCFEPFPSFNCQTKSNGYCSIEHLGNCNFCPEKPETAYSYMAGLARKYLKDKFQFTYRKSLFSMKPILISSEIDDSRPTLIRTYSEKPYFISVLSGKINTVYDLDEVLDYE